MKIDSYLSPSTKLKSKCIKDLKIKPATLTSKGTVLNITPAAQTLRETINKWDLLKLKSFCKAKDIVNKTKQQHTNWERSSLTPH